MPGKRADGVHIRSIPLHDDLWDAVKAKATRDGLTTVAAARELFTMYAEGKITLPPPEPDS